MVEAYDWLAFDELLLPFLLVYLPSLVALSFSNQWQLLMAASFLPSAGNEELLDELNLPRELSLNETR